MAEELKWFYEKLDAEGKIEAIYENKNDFDRRITGKFVFGVKEYFDENPEERKRLGWIKHIQHGTKDIEYNHQTQYLEKIVKIIDEYTVEDEYRVMDKSDEQMRHEEMGGDWIIIGAGD